MTVGPCGSGTAGVIVKLSLFLEGPGHGQSHLQELRPRGRRRRIPQFVRRGYHGHCPQPPSAAGARDSLHDQGPFHSEEDPRPPIHAVNSGCSGSPETSVTRCNDMRKIAACWTCGRTFWVWRLRESNFCSGKCRVRHHRARGYRGSRTSRSGGEIDSRMV